MLITQQNRQTTVIKHVSGIRKHPARENTLGGWLTTGGVQQGLDMGMAGGAALGAALCFSGGVLCWPWWWLAGGGGGYGGICRRVALVAKLRGRMGQINTISGPLCPYQTIAYW